MRTRYAPGRPGVWPTRPGYTRPVAKAPALPAFREIGAATGTIVKAGYRINA